MVTIHSANTAVNVVGGGWPASGIDPVGARVSRTGRYVARSTQDCDAVAIVREHWPAFRERVGMHAGSLTTFVCGELEAFATCGDFSQGFLVAQCRRYVDTLRVPFACKSGGGCPSCMGRRMCESAALLVEHRLPAGPWRQWVLAFQGSMAVRLGYDKRLLVLVCQRFAKRVMQTLHADLAECALDEGEPAEDGVAASTIGFLLVAADDFVLIPAIGVLIVLAVLIRGAPSTSSLAVAGVDRPGELAHDPHGPGRPFAGQDDLVCGP